MRIDLSAPVSIEATLSALTAFGRWWISELSALLPEASRRRIEGALARPHMRLYQDRWLISWPGAQIAEIALDASLPNPEFRAGLMQAIEGQLNPSVILELPERDYLRRRIMLPKAALGSLRPVISLQIDKLSPFRSSEVEFSARVVESVEDVGEATVEVVIVPRAVIERYHAWLTDAGVRLVIFSAESGAHAIRSGMSGLGLRGHMVDWGLAAAGSILVAAALALTPSLREAEVGNLTRQVGDLRGRAQVAEQAKETLDQIDGATTFLDQNISGSQPIDILREITVLTSDSTYLTDLTIEGDMIHISGATPDTNALARRLARSGRFGSVKISGLRLPQGDHTNHFIIIMRTKLDHGPEHDHGL